MKEWSSTRNWGICLLIQSLWSWCLLTQLHPLCCSSIRAQDEWLHRGIGPLRGSWISSHFSLADSYPTVFHRQILYEYPSQFWCSLPWGLLQELDSRVLSDNLHSWDFSPELQLQSVGAWPALSRLYPPTSLYAISTFHSQVIRVLSSMCPLIIQFFCILVVIPVWIYEHSVQHPFIPQPFLISYSCIFVISLSCPFKRQYRP